MKQFFSHARSYIFRGLLAIIPLLLSVIAVRLLYELIDKRVVAFLDQFIHVRQIPGLGILLILICLYFIGLVVSSIFGRQILLLIEYVSAAFPLEAGDVISTGTPGGVGMFMTPPRWLRKGDRVEATIEGIGTLSNPVI